MNIVNTMKVVGSSKVIRASAALRQEFRLPQIKAGKVADLRELTDPYLIQFLRGSLTSMKLVPPAALRDDIPAELMAMVPRGPVENAVGGLFFKHLMLIAYKDMGIKIGDGFKGSYLGDFAFTEYKSGRFSATAFMMNGGSAADKYEKDNVLPPVKGASALEILYAGALITFEEWLGTSAIEEYRIEHPRVGLTYQFTFGKKMPDIRRVLDLRGSASTPFHTLS